MTPIGEQRPQAVTPSPSPAQRERGGPPAVAGGGVRVGGAVRGASEQIHQ